MERPRRRAIQLVGVLLLIALVATTGGVLAGLSSSDESDVDDARAELAALVNERAGETFEARYVVQLPEVENDRLRMTVWQDGARFRHDLVLARPDGTEHLSVINDGARRVRCTLREGGSWKCAEADSRTSSEVESLLSDVVRGLPGELSARSTEIGGHAVRCFSGSAGAGTVEVCLDGDGVIVRASTLTADLELVEYRDSVNEVIFVPPA